ncbi:thioesterase family protein [Bacillus sp. FJAT-49736]|uniref:acyl-CoA thioesterase n=1 Tax=Bacillus sp. FJAT-49736 TaxID=2833582 RepID=UPI001BC999A5|nr:thioesterase family protein [Bacillus sp. FJAT-49736]MBS4173744.1 acyl-CoA thioesterase [Bacillus sp. FJAT-49736]
MKKISYIEDFSAWKNEFSFSHFIKVRFSETDMFGHLNNTVPFTYFEEARIEFLHYKGFMKDWVTNNKNAIPVVADLQCDFLQPVFFGDTLKLFVKANQVGNSSVDLHYLAINQKEEVCLVGRGAMVQMSTITGKGVPWEEEEKLKLLQ